MRNFKPCLTAILLTWGTLHTSVGFAETASAQNPPQAQNFTDQSVEEMIAISKVGQQNEAVNDAVLGNEAIAETLPQIGGVTNQQDTDVSASIRSSTAPVTPRQSTAQSVDSDKLILNTPVVDQADVLSPQEEAALSQKLRGLYDRGLAQAALVVVPSTGNLDIFDYTLQVADRWKLGNADTDDGLLILVSVNDRKMYILSGYGLEGVLPDAVLNRIIDTEITPYFRQGKYAAGIVQGIDEITARLTADPEALARADSVAAQRPQARPTSSNQEPPSVFGLFIISMVFGMFLTSILGRIIGSLLVTGGFAVVSLLSGGSLILTIPMAVFLWVFLSARGSGGGKGGGRGGRGGGVVFFPGGGLGGGGGFGGGGFGGGGFGGGGGGFGGGGAGGSW